MENDSKDIPSPYQWIKEEKFNITQGTTYYEPKVTIRHCASLMKEYVDKYYS